MGRKKKERPERLPAPPPKRAGRRPKGDPLAKLKPKNTLKRVRLFAGVYFSEQEAEVLRKLIAESGLSRTEWLRKMLNMDER